MLIELAGDLVCPWCYIGKRRLERALAARPGVAARILWRSFQLNPEIPSFMVPARLPAVARAGRAPAGRNREAVVRAGLGEGIQFRFDALARPSNSTDGHRLVRLAARQGSQMAAVDGLFRRYFEAGEDIGRAAVLLDAALEIGLDRGETVRFLASDEERDAVQADDRATRRLGIAGVPCFIIAGRYALSGAQEPEFFLPLLDLAALEERESAAAE